MADAPLPVRLTPWPTRRLHRPGNPGGAEKAAPGGGAWTPLLGTAGLPALGQAVSVGTLRPRPRPPSLTHRPLTDLSIPRPWFTA